MNKQKVRLSAAPVATRRRQRRLHVCLSRAGLHTMEGGEERAVDAPTRTGDSSEDQ